MILLGWRPVHVAPLKRNSVTSGFILFVTPLVVRSVFSHFYTQERFYGLVSANGSKLHPHKAIEENVKNIWRTRSHVCELVFSLLNGSVQTGGVHSGRFNLELHLFCCRETRGDVDIFSQRVLAQMQKVDKENKLAQLASGCEDNDAVPVRYCQPLKYISIIEMWPADQKTLHLYSYALSEQCKT